MPWRTLWSGDALFSAVIALVLPVALHMAGLSALNRLAYPALAFVGAGILYARGSPWYLGFCVWLFAASPLIRRLADFHLGFEPTSAILLAPYVACLWAALSGVGYCLGPRPRFAGAFLVMLGCVLYGFVLSVFDGRATAAAVESVKWAVGPLVALHIIANPGSRPAFREAVVAAFVSAGFLMALYGAAQFVNPAPWDVEWLNNMLRFSAAVGGSPEPFAIRVFSTMHSAGSAGAFLAAAMVFAIALPMAVALPCLLPIMLAIGLCQYRSIWAGTLVAIACVAAIGPARERTRIVLCAVVVGLSLGSLSAVPEMEYTLGNRLRSLTELGADESGEQRLQQYARFLYDNENLLFGMGLGTGGGSQIQEQSDGPGYIDGGLLVSFVALGVVAAGLFFAALALTVCRACAATGRLPGEGYLYAAMLAGWVLQLPFGSVHIGEHGFPAWLVIGLSLAASAGRTPEA